MHKYVKKSEEIYTNEIDVVNIINYMRQLKVLLRVLLTQNQLKIIEFANYRSLSQKYSDNTSFVESIIETDSKHKFEKLCNELNQDDKNKEGLSIKSTKLIHYCMFLSITYLLV